MCKNIKSKKAKVIENMKKSLHEQEKEVEFLAVSNYNTNPNKIRHASKKCFLTFACCEVEERNCGLIMLCI